MVWAHEAAEIADRVDEGDPGGGSVAAKEGCRQGPEDRGIAVEADCSDRQREEGSAKVIAGSSTGNPPACQAPRLTPSTRCLKCAWQGLMSLEVLTMAMTGFPA
jgi:hypothetical protein